MFIQTDFMRGVIANNLNTHLQYFFGLFSAILISTLLLSNEIRCTAPFDDVLMFDHLEVCVLTWAIC